MRQPTTGNLQTLRLLFQLSVGSNAAIPLNAAHAKSIEIIGDYLDLSGLILTLTGSEFWANSQFLQLRLKRFEAPLTVHIS